MKDLVVTNFPPEPGFLDSEPTNSTETEYFYLSAAYWTDDDVPLSYIFGYLDTFDDNTAAVANWEYERPLAYKSFKSTGFGGCFG